MGPTPCSFSMHQTLKRLICVGMSLSLRHALMKGRSHSSCVWVSKCTSISVVRPEGPPALLRPR